jgi:hypothetical protein
VKCVADSILRSIFFRTRKMYSATTRSIRCCTPLRLRTLALILSKHSTNLVKTLIDIAVVDRIRSRSRFTINYLLLSTRLNQRVQLRTFAGETTVLPSLATPFMRATLRHPTTGGLEHKVYDLLGRYSSNRLRCNSTVNSSNLIQKNIFFSRSYTTYCARSVTCLANKPAGKYTTPYSLFPTRPADKTALMIRPKNTCILYAAPKKYQ